MDSVHHQAVFLIKDGLNFAWIAIKEFHNARTNTDICIYKSRCNSFQIQKNYLANFKKTVHIIYIRVGCSFVTVATANSFCDAEKICYDYSKRLEKLSTTQPTVLE